MGRKLPLIAELAMRYELNGLSAACTQYATDSYTIRRVAREPSSRCAGFPPLGLQPLALGCGSLGPLVPAGLQSRRRSAAQGSFCNLLGARYAQCAPNSVLAARTASLLVSYMTLANYILDGLVAAQNSSNRCLLVRRASCWAAQLCLGQ